MGAKFSSGSGATVFYDDGPITAPSGEQGTQRTEFEAAIKSVTSSTDVGAVFVYDTRNDSDGGAWRKKARGSWYYETLNTATRGGRREFPSVALIVADNGGSDETLSIYDLDDPSMPLWMQFQTTAQASPYHDFWRGARDVSAITALNGRIYFSIGGTNDQAGVKFVDFTSDRLGNYNTASSLEWSGYFSGGVADRNSDSKTFLGNTLGAIVHRNVNNVATTIIEGAEIGALGLPIPTIAVATAGGVSVIHPNGDVYDDTYQVATSKEAGAVGFNSTGGYWYASRLTSGEYQYFINRHNLIYADTSSSTGTEMYRAGASAAGTPSLSLLGGASTRQTAWADTKNTYAIGSTSGLSLIKYNTGNPSEGAVCDVTSTYNTGYMLGDIKGAWLTGGDASAEGRYDRSVGNTDLVENGTVLHAAAETDAEITKYYDFSASNYFSQAHNADFDFGTGDFSIMFWAKWTASGTDSQYFIDRATGSAGRFIVYDPSSGGKPQFICLDGSTSATITTTNDYNDGNWHQVVAVRRSSKIYIYVDGVDAQTTSVASTANVNDSSATMKIGVSYGSTYPLNGSLSLLRISATAPTPQQVKEIYEAEKPLFRAGAKCLLQSDDASPNAVNDLSYDASTDLLHVFQNGDTVGENLFRGLEVVESRGRKSDGWTYSSASYGAAAGGVSASARALSGGGVIVDLPAIDVRGDINTADTKLPDDGKLHFSGVTTNATPTVIGQIPIAENESYTVIARVMGLRYNNANSDIRHFCEIKQQFTRRVGGDVVEETQISKLEEGDWASLDVDLDYDAGADTIRVEVTGDGSSSPGPYRVVWNAEVEVQRISDKQYER